MNARHTLKLIFGVILSLTAWPALAGSISGTAHDFSANTWSGGEICVVCHTPHGADTSVVEAPLWNHDVTTTAFTTYNSPTFNSTTGQPAGSSKLCLSCHDGTIAVDSFGGATGTNFLNAADPKTVGANGDLSNDHPISFAYDTALAATDGGLFDPSIATATIGTGAQTKTGTLADVMLLGGQVQCASCHDVHNTFAATQPLLKISNAGSGLCLTCHNK